MYTLLITIEIGTSRYSGHTCIGTLKQAFCIESYQYIVIQICIKFVVYLVNQCRRAMAHNVKVQSKVHVLAISNFT